MVAILNAKRLRKVQTLTTLADIKAGRQAHLQSKISKDYYTITRKFNKLELRETKEK